MGKETESRLAERYGRTVVYMTTGGFEHLVDQLGGEFLGFSARAAWGDALLVMRAEFAGRGMVAFVTGVTVASAISKAQHDLRHNKTKWQPDKYATNGRKS